MSFLKLIRCKNLIIIAALQYLLRYVLLLPILFSYDLLPALTHFQFAVVVLSTVVFAASGYIINDYFDIRADRINKPEGVIVGIKYERRKVLMWHVIFTLVGLFLGLSIAYAFRKESYVLMYLAIPVLLWIYSTTFKRQMLIGNLLISFLTALVAYLVVSVEFSALIVEYGNQITSSEACSAAWFWTSGFAFFAFIATLGREIIKDIEDKEGDKAIKCSTLPIELGVVNTKVIVLLINGLSLFMLWFFFFWIPQLKQDKTTLLYFIFLLTIPYILLSIQIVRAKSKSHFHLASQFSKVIMLLGILFVFVIRQFFI